MWMASRVPNATGRWRDGLATKTTGHRENLQLDLSRAGFGESGILERHNKHVLASVSRNVGRLPHSSRPGSARQVYAASVPPCPLWHSFTCRICTSSRTKGAVLAISGLSIELETGEVFAFIRLFAYACRLCFRHLVHS